MDGIVGGQRESPLSPSPVKSRIVLGGINPAAVDTVAAIFMGYDIKKIPIIARAFDQFKYPLADFGPSDIQIKSNNRNYSLDEFCADGPRIPFEPSIGWKGRIEQVKD